MAIIQNTQALNMFDRLACEQQILSAAIDDVASGLSWYQRVHAPLDDVLGDPDVEQDLVISANSLDKDYRSGTILSNVYGGWVRALQRHIQNQGLTNIDTFLSTKQINVHEDFNAINRGVFGTDLDAINVFRKNEVAMATVDFTGSGVCVFTDGAALGTGTGKFSSINSAAASVKAKVISAGGTGATDIILKIVGLDEASAQVISSSATIPGSSPVDTEVAVVTSAPLLDVTAVQCAGGNNNDQVQILNIADRTLNECSGTILSFDGT